MATERQNIVLVVVFPKSCQV